jgi:uncharacterized protein with FMN-binding domain
MILLKHKKELKAVKGKKKLLFIVVLAILAGLGYGAKYYWDLTNYRRTINELTIEDVNLAGIPDGNYTGSMDTVWVGASVMVTVKNHVITDIQLDHRHDRGAAAEVIPAQVVQAQSLRVDLISGATSSSKLILKAIENALNEARN